MSEISEISKFPTTFLATFFEFKTISPNRMNTTFTPSFLNTTTLLSEQFQINVPLISDSSVQSEINEICLAFNRNVRNIHVESIHASGVVERLRKCFSAASHRRNISMIRLNRERVETFLFRGSEEETEDPPTISSRLSVSKICGIKS